MGRLVQILKYINYWQGAKSRHSIHSPFVYELVSSAFKNVQEDQACKDIEELRRQLLTDTSVIEVIDLGAGSKINSSDHRSIAEIAKNSSVKPKYGRLLHQLAFHLDPTSILELGTSLGFATMYLSTGASAAKVHTIEGSPNTAHLAIDNFNKLGLNNIQVETGAFDDVLPQLLHKLDQLGLVFFDGNHRKEPTLKYFKMCLEKVSNDSVFIFDDIHWSGEMEEAWAIIKKNPKVSVTIDVFQLGIVFFRKGQAKEDFIIRY